MAEKVVPALGVTMCVVTIALAASGLALTANPCALRLREGVRDAKEASDPDPATLGGAEQRFAGARFFSGTAIAVAVLWIVLSSISLGCNNENINATAKTACSGVQKIAEPLKSKWALIVGVAIMVMAMVGNIMLYNAGYTVVEPGPGSCDTIPVASTDENQLDAVRMASVIGLTLFVGVGVGVVASQA